MDIFESDSAFNRLKRRFGFNMDQAPIASAYILEVKIIKLINSKMNSLDDDEIISLSTPTIKGRENITNYLHHKVKKMNMEALQESYNFLEVNGVTDFFYSLNTRAKKIKK